MENQFSHAVGSNRLGTQIPSSKISAIKKGAITVFMLFM